MQSKPDNIEATLATLRGELTKLREAEQKLESQIKENLEKEFTFINTILVKYTKEWSDHENKFIDELDNQLKKQGLILNDAEKGSLHDDINHSNTIQNILTKLKEYNINLPPNTPNFTIVTYGVIVSVLGRNLKPINEKTLKNIIDKLW
jgi:hypothetical protein